MKDPNEDNAEQHWPDADDVMERFLQELRDSHEGEGEDELWLILTQLKEDMEDNDV